MARIPEGFGVRRPDRSVRMQPGEATEELRTSFAVEAVDVFDPFVDEEPLECGIDEYEDCESCQ